MDRAAALDRLISMFESDREIMENNVIFHAEGKYSVFGRYDIEPQAHTVLVFREREFQAEFHDIRTALSWCIAKKYQQTELASDLEKLDREHRRLQQDIEFDQQMVNRIHDRDRRFVVTTKIDHHRSRLALIKNRLSKCVSRAKYCQIRGFNDEIARTRRPAPHKTSRPGTRKPSRSKH